MTQLLRVKTNSNSTNTASFTRRPPSALVLTVLGFAALVGNVLFLTWQSVSLVTTINANYGSLLLLEPSSSSSLLLFSSQENPDGLFQGHPLYYKTGAPKSRIHCVGDNFEEDGWMRKSCSFEHLCFDLDTRSYVVFANEMQQKLANLTHKSPFVMSAFDLNEKRNSMALGSLNKKWNWDPEKGVPRLKWFPKVISGTDAVPGYYELPKEVLMIPYHAYNGGNPGHLIWDDFMPMYFLMRIFGFDQGQTKLLPIRHILPGEPLWATCQFDPTSCQQMYNKFQALLLGNSSTIPTNLNISAVTHQDRKTNLVCARHAAAGFGFLNDHGIKEHGWEPDDYHQVHNLARGSLFYDMRNYMMNHIGASTSIDNDIPLAVSTPPTIVFSIASSQTRKYDLSLHIQATKEQFPHAIVHVVEFRTMSLYDQVQLMAKTSIFVSGVGGSAVTAIFLPQGASVILFFPERGGVQYGSNTHLPARLDWDVFNNLAHVRPHWLPSQQNIQSTLPIFLTLVQQELETQGYRRSASQ